MAKAYKRKSKINIQAIQFSYDNKEIINFVGDGFIEVKYFTDESNQRVTEIKILGKKIALWKGDYLCKSETGIFFKMKEKDFKNNFIEDESENLKFSY